VRRAALRGRGPSSSTKLQERRCSESKRCEAAEVRRKHEAALGAPRFQADPFGAAATKIGGPLLPWYAAEPSFCAVRRRHQRSRPPRGPGFSPQAQA